MKIAVGLALLIVVPQISFAQMYRCEEPGGKIVYTDKQPTISPRCQAIYGKEETGLKPAFERPTATSLSKPTVSPRQEGKVERGGEAYRAFVKEAEALVEQFEATRKRIYRSTKARDKIKARQDLKEVRSEKKLLLARVDRSRLSRSQIITIREMLAKIQGD